jgi:8-oxo-dGTP pyrophosphatase MutT (NUDIX family)
MEIMDKNKVHYLVVTGIIINNEGKYLIVKRADWEKAFPSRWTVPGGKIEVLDYILREKDTPHHWYNVLEDNLKREVFEEVGLEISEIGYVTSLVYIRPDKIPCMIISLYAKTKTQKIRLCNSLTEYAWIELSESKEYDLIEGIYEELEVLEKKLKSSQIVEWAKKDANL